MMILDAETASCIHVAAKLALTTPQMEEAQKWIRGRIEIVAAGVDKVPDWFRKQLRDFDTDLRARWDFYQGAWMIERYNRLGDQLYWPVTQWKGDLGALLIQKLREGDTWNHACEQKFSEEQGKAEKTREKNEKTHNDQVAAAVDSLSLKSIKQFIEVHEAMQSGETITAHGDDLKAFERMEADRKRALAAGEQPEVDTCINPGMHPQFYKRPNRSN